MSDQPTEKPSIQELANRVANDQDADVVFYNGSMDRLADHTRPLSSRP